MAEPVYETFTFCGGKENFFDKIKIENKTDLAVEGNKLLLKSAEIFYKNGEIVEDKIKYSGRAVFYLTYLNSEGEINKYESSSDFEGEITIKDFQDKTLVGIKFDLLRIEADENGGEYGISATVEVIAEIRKCVKIQAFNGGEGFIRNEKEEIFYKSIGAKKINYPVEYEFETEYSIGEVLSQNAEPFITAVQCGTDTVIVDGEIVFRALFLQSGEKSGIICEEKKIPFRAEMDFEGAEPSATAIAQVAVRSLKSDLSVDTAAAKSVCDLTVSLVFFVEVFSEEKQSITVDTFSTEKELFVERESCECYEPESARSYSLSSRLKSGGEFRLGTTYICAVGEKTDIVSSTCKGDSLSAEGAVSATAYFSDEEGKIFSARIDAPFDLEIPCVGSCENVTGARLIIREINVLSENEAEVIGETYFTLTSCEKKDVKYVKTVTETGDKKVCDAAISVYIPVRGDDLWSLSKRLGIAPEKLAETNGNLEFPLAGGERIVVYRKK